MKQALYRCLDSMQKDGLLTWHEFHRFIPSVVVDVEGSKLRMPKTLAEAAKAMKKCEEFCRTECAKENVVLDPELIASLNILDERYWDSPEYPLCSDYQQAVYRMKGYPVPIRASDRQEKAISNFDGFMKQYAYKEFCGSKSYMKLENIPNDCEFFKNAALSQLYMELVEEFSPWLIGCKVIWRELEYEVNTDTEVFTEALKKSEVETVDYAGQLTQLFLEYMDSHMDAFYFTAGKKDIQDTELTFGRPLINGRYTLSNSKSAQALHEKLKTLCAVPS